MSEIGQSGLGSGQLAGAFIREPPVVVVTAPSGPQNTETVTVTWTYASGISRPQASYRVQVLDQAGSVVLYDSGAIPGTALSFACPFYLSGGSAYQAKVTCSDGVDEGFGLLAFSSDLSGLSSYSPSEQVGSTYEIAINGVGYRLADTPERPYRRSTGQLQVPRLATGDTPFSEAIERYTFVGTGDWSLGAGQRIGNRQTSDSRAFWTSENVNPFEPGKVTLLPTTTQLTTIASNDLATVASGALLVQSGTDTLKHYATPTSSPTTMTFTLSGGAVLNRITSDGEFWYVADTSEKIFRGNSTTPGTAWADLSSQTGLINLMSWCTDRLVVVYSNGSGQSVLSTIAPDGTEEVVGGRFKYTDASITAVASGDGYLWYALNRTDRSVIYAWKLGSSDAPFIALDMPTGEYVTQMYYYLGNLMMRAALSASGTIYRAVPNAGELTPERVVEGTGVQGGFVGHGHLVLFGWAGMSDDGRSGIGAIDLSTGGWCRWLQAPSSSDVDTPDYLVVWKDKVGFTVRNYGFMYTSDTPSATGYVTSSAMDLASSLVKVLDAVSLNTDPLPTDSSVEVLISFDAGVSFTSIGALEQPGSREGRWLLSYQGSSIGVKVVMNATGLISPSVTMTQVKLHPLSVTDQVVELPIACGGRLAGLNGVEIVDGRDAVERARVLESLVGTRVLFQDVDYPSTGLAETWEMVSAEYSSVGVFERRAGSRQEAAAVCVCTLRRAR